MRTWREVSLDTGVDFLRKDRSRSGAGVIF